MQQNKVTHYLFLLNNVLFIGLYALLSYYNRPSGDDFFSIYLVNKAGVIGGSQEFYTTWSGRWTSTAFNLFAAQFLHLKYFLLFYQLLMLFSFAFVVKKLLNTLLPSNRNNLFMALYFAMAAFYCSFTLNESWFFFSATFIYMWSLIFLFLGISSLLSSEKNILSIGLISLSFVYIGGSSEPLTITVLMALSLLIIVKLLRIKINSAVNTNKLLLAFIACLISFVISYAANGNRVREQFFPQLSVYEAVLLNIKMTGIIILKQIPIIVPYVFLFSVPAFYWGVVNSGKYNDANSIKKRLIQTPFIFGCIVFIFQLPITYVTSDIGALRTLLPISIITLICFGMLMYYLGVLMPSLLATSRKLNIYSFTVLCAMLFYTIITQYPIVSNYAAQYDERMDYIDKNKNAEQQIKLKPLPYSGLIFSDDLSNDTTHYTNQHLQKALNLKHIPIVP